MANREYCYRVYPMEPLDLLDSPGEDDKPDAHESSAAKKSRLNTHVAVSVALLATFLGICKIKDDNIVQGMQQAQANRVDDWSLYQARNIREEIAKATVAQLQAQRLALPATQRTAIDQQIASYQDLATRENQKKQQQKEQAENDQKTYDALNYHDDQFDLSEASLSIAISLFAITSLTQKRWLFFIALIPTALGVVMGTAGLLGGNLHPDVLIKPLSQTINQDQRIYRT